MDASNEAANVSPFEVKGGPAQARTAGATPEALGLGFEAQLRLPPDPLAVIVFVDDEEHAGATAVSDYLLGALRMARLGTLVLRASDPVLRSHRAERGGEPATGERVRLACEWLQAYPVTTELPIGLVGSGRAADGALAAAARMQNAICALVGRGLDDIAGIGASDAELGVLSQISAPTLLIAGGLDEAAMRPTRRAYARLRCKKRFEIVPGATRAFDEPGALEVTVRLTRNWFLQHAYRQASHHQHFYSREDA